MEFVTGGKEIQIALRSLPSKLQRSVVNKAASKAAQVIVKQARADAPVDGGAIKRNIKKEAWRSRFYAKVFAIGVAHGKVPKNIGGGFGESRDSKGKLSIKKLTVRERRGDDPFYFRWQELGWKHAKSGENIKGKDFLKNAIDKKGIEAIRIYGDELKIAVNKLGKPA